MYLSVSLTSLGESGAGCNRVGFEILSPEIHSVLSLHLCTSTETFQRYRRECEGFAVVLLFPRDCYTSCALKPLWYFRDPIVSNPMIYKQLSPIRACCRPSKHPLLVRLHQVCCGDRGPNYALSDFIESAVNRSVSCREPILDEV